MSAAFQKGVSVMQRSDGIADLVAICHRVYARGMVGGSGGNVSIRSGDRILITPTGIRLGDVEEGDVVALSAEGAAEGTGQPSKEWRMHLACYRRADVNAVIHVHSAYSVAAATLADLDLDCALPVYTPGYAVRVGRLPAVPYLRPGSAELAETVAEVIARRDSVLLANHGVLAAAGTLTAALNLIEEIEENAHLHFTLGGWGRPLTEAQQRDLVGKY